MTLANQTSDVNDRIQALEHEVDDLRKHLDRLEFQNAVRRGQTEAEKGLIVPAQELVASLRKKYNLPTP